MQGCLYDTSSKLVFYTGLLALLDSKCSDEEHTTCSGGSVAKERGTTRLAQGSEGSQKLRHIVRTTTSHFLFIINFIIFILSFIDIMHLLRIS
jgi:hypothetical protein